MTSCLNVDSYPLGYLRELPLFPVTISVVSTCFCDCEYIVLGIFISVLIGGIYILFSLYAREIIKIDERLVLERMSS